MTAYRNRNSPWFKVADFIDQSGLGNRFIFAPLYGIGDRAAFYAYFNSFQTVHGSEVAILCLNGRPDPVAELFAALDGRVFTAPADVAVAPLELTHWIYGSPTPAAGQIFFTWHWSFGDGSQAAQYESQSAKVVQFTHKNLIKKILALPENLSASRLRLPVSSHVVRTRNQPARIMLCPASNTIASPDQAWWIKLAEWLRSLGLEPVVNVDSSASAINRTSKSYAEFSRYRAFMGTVSDFLQEVSGYEGVITARSGLCELLALAGTVRYAVVSAQPVSPFWRLGDGFGTAPDLELKVLTDAGDVSFDMVQRTVRTWVSV